MRILQLTSSMPLTPSGSNAPFILHTARALRDRGHEIHLVAPHHPGLAWPEREGDLHFHFFRYAPVRRWNVWGYGMSLQSDVRLKGPVYAVLPLAAAAAFCTLRRLQRQLRFDLVHAHWLLPNGPIAALARRGRAPLCINLHGSDLYVASKRAMFRRAARFSLRRAAAVVGCSEDLTERARRMLPVEGRHHTLPYGVDERQFCPPAAREGPPTILAAGRLVEKKGFEYLLQGMKAMKNPARLVIAGGGDLDEMLRRQSAELGLEDRVRFAGEISQPEMIELYRSCSIFALPSIRDSGGNVDGLPNVLLEAMSSGMAVVASEIGGVPQVIADGREGLLVPQKDATRLAAALDQVASDPALRGRLGDDARKTILDRHTWREYARRLEEIFEGAARS